MQADHQAQLAFYMTGKSPGDGLDPIETLKLEPALFARYRDLIGLRYDFPLVLVPDAREGAFARSLTAIVDRLLDQVAPPGTENERLRSHVLRLEREIRALVAAGHGGTLSQLWNTAAERLGAGADELLEDSMGRAAAALKLDGEVVDCDAALPVRLVTHAWRQVKNDKARKFRTNARRLTLKLSDILRADFARSQAGQTAANLKAAVGAAHSNVFDFEVMSRLLSKAAPQVSLSKSRRQRIDRALSVLKAQKFFPTDEDSTRAGDNTYSFMFESCAEALAAYRERLPKMVELAKAIAIAELEIEGQYVEPRHDVFFAEFGQNALKPEDLALFPDYLVCIRVGDMGAAAYGELMALLAAGLPVKILVQNDDILQESLIGDGRLTCGMRSARLASMATGLNDVYVLQSSASHLVQFTERMYKGLAYPGAALFSVFSGANRHNGEVPTYLVAAAAMESRAFPAFCYDPSAGADWASRFSLEHNPQPERDWPVHNLAYEDADHQRDAVDLGFTFVDFVACDRRYAGHFARVPRAQWDGSMLPVAECIAHPPQRVPEEIPFTLMTDADARLHRVIVSDQLVLEARRIARMWMSLQELGGIHNSYAERLLAREKQAWEAQHAAAAPLTAEVPPASKQPSVPTPAAAPAPADTGPADAEPAPPSDEAYVETPRCTTCEECVTINNRMFVYDENKQAYIADINAGTYRQLVEAAESCQVSIIHPGKPRNPNEPGLAELLKRAEPFL
jgi:ferredoxin